MHNKGIELREGWSRSKDILEAMDDAGGDIINGRDDAEGRAL